MKEIHLVKWVRVFAICIVAWGYSHSTQYRTFAICDALLQSISGSGANEKLGFVCGIGCNTKYYLVADADYSSKCTLESFTRYDTGCGTYEDHTYEEVETITGDNFSYKVRFEPETCISTSTVTGTASSLTRSKRNSVGYGSVCNGTIASSSCSSVKVDNVEITDSEQSCGDLSISTTGYTVVSETTETVPCEGTKTTTIYKDESENSRTIIKCEEVSGDGYKSEYTTKLAISRAKHCATSNLNDASFPTELSASGSAGSSMLLAGDNSSAAITLSKWRLALVCTDPDEEYEITLNWIETVNNKPRTYSEVRTTKGSEAQVFYYPSDSGELINVKESETCGYSYSKVLSGASVKVKEKKGK